MVGGLHLHTCTCTGPDSDWTEVDWHTGKNWQEDGRKLILSGWERTGPTGKVPTTSRPLVHWFIGPLDHWTTGPIIHESGGGRLLTRTTL